MTRTLSAGRTVRAADQRRILGRPRGAVRGRQGKCRRDSAAGEGHETRPSVAVAPRSSSASATIGEMYVERAGDAGPKVVLVHGTATPGGANWGAQRPLATDHRLVLPHRTG